MKNIIILGLSNDLFSDEGPGICAVEAMHAQYIVPENVTLIKGCIEGAALLSIIEDTDILLIVDAVDFALKPGTVVQLDDAQVLRRLHKYANCLHQTSIVDTLRQARREGHLPARIQLVGVQPVGAETYSNPLSGSAKVQIDTAVAAIVEFLAESGITAVPRPENIPANPLTPIALDISATEAGCFA